MDLQTLSRTRTSEPASPADGAAAAGRVPRPRRRWATRLILPTAIAAATLALLGYAARGWLMPAAEVEFARATAIGRPAGDRGAATPSAGPKAVVAQAPGWVEPDPYPIYVTALADGVVETVYVLEGDRVTAEQLLVELVDDDAKLALDRARAELQRREAVATAARADFDEPVALTRAAQVARAQLAGAEAALAKLDAEVAKELARLNELAATYDRLGEMTERSVSALQVEAAKYQVESQRAVVEATRQRRPELDAAVDAAEAEAAAAERDLELKTALRRARDEAVAAAEEARTAVAEAQLRFDRMTIKSPVGGVVMNRLVAPGDKLKLAADGQHTAHAIHLYDPASLQVRVDVPLADAAAVGVGQEAVIVVDVLPDIEFAGVVTRVVHRADIAKNTVQFKVAIKNPSPLLKPDMLARVKFLGRPGGGTGGTGEAARGGEGTGGPVVALAATAVVRGGDGGAFVWWVSPTDQRLSRRAVAVGGDRGDGTVEVYRGLNPGDVVIAQPDTALEEGQRVRPSNREE